ncbi:MAG: RnfH family protein [Kistimonas sp.]|nr:RnfH family protein [Kistimonas sp.]
MVAEDRLGVEVVCALPHRQRLVRIRVLRGTTMRSAVMQSGLAEHFPEIDLATAPLGIFGKQVTEPDSRELADGERVEVYRPLLTDPRELRRQRALKVAARRSGKGKEGPEG